MTSGFNDAKDCAQREDTDGIELIRWTAPFRLLLFRQFADMQGVQLVRARLAQVNVVRGASKAS